MPHAVDADELQNQQDDAEIARLINSHEPNQNLEFMGRDLELGEKADDAEDFEDIGDDDLASEEDDGESRTLEVGSGDLEHGLETRDDDDAPLDLGLDDDLFGEDEATSPAAEEVLHNGQAAVQPIKGGLALPTKSGIALPGSFAQNGHTFASLASYAPRANAQPFAQQPDAGLGPDHIDDSGHENGDRAEEDEEEELDPAARLQRELFAGAGAGDTAPHGPTISMEEFYAIWPSYDPDKTPRFTELFPPMQASFNWKTPLKPPKQIQPTKVSLEIAQDTERSFRLMSGAAAAKGSRGQELEDRGIVYATRPRSEEQESSDDVDMDEIDEGEEIGGVSFRDIALVCEDWDLGSVDSAGIPPADSGIFMDEDSATLADEPPTKRRKLSPFDIKTAASMSFEYPVLDDPEHATERLAKRVALNMNDPDLLIDENVPVQTKRSTLGSMRRDARGVMARDISRRYNISNDEAYELLKENHQHKVRSTLGSMSIEHSLPAVHLQYPFYKVKLEARQLRSFHRPNFTAARMGKENRFSKSKRVKRKELKNLQTRDIFAKSEDLSMGDNSSGLLLEYSEERPTMLSNFGMGNRLVNFYRRKDEQDNARPKEEIGETQILLPQDRSPFANFGQVNPGEIVPAIQNGLYRAPVFKHEGRPTDFIVVSNTTHENGSRFYLRNVENLHTVGQQFPSTEVPGEHSRKVTTAAKDRLKAISYRVWGKWSVGRSKNALNNAVVQAHLPGSDIAQNRGKMREFMQYDKVNQIWVPKSGGPDMTPEQIRAPVKPEEVCVLDAMQVGVQHLADLGLRENDEVNEDEDDKEGTNIELLLAPWSTTKNFINACQGKAMLQLHGEGDPTRRGEGFSFIKTSMKGGFRALGESIEERLDAKKLKENNGHSYNVARQQRAYDESIRRIWRAQTTSLSSNVDHSDAEADIDDEPEETFAADRGQTPRTSFGTPATFARREDESVSQFSRTSAHTGGAGSGGHNKNQTLVITRKSRDKYGQLEEIPVTITNPRIIAAYKKAKYREQMSQINPLNITKTGDAEFDAAQLRAAADEVARLERNMDRRHARERAKGIAGSPDAGSPLGGDGDEDGAGAVGGGGTSGPGGEKTGKKGRKKANAEGTGRRCANCGQVGHIKTNKKLCPMLNGTMKPEDAQTGFGSGPAGGDAADSNIANIGNGAQGSGFGMPGL